MNLFAMNYSKYFFFLLIILNYSCKEKKNTSMFLFFPNSKEEILDNGYQKDQKLNYYEKVNDDTTETIGHWSDDTKAFTKHFYVKTPNKMSIAQKEEMLYKISDFILANSDTVYFNQLHSSLFKIQGRNLALLAGYSVNASYFSITMYTLNSPANKKIITNHLEQLKTLQDKSIDADRINYAINLANELR